MGDLANGHACDAFILAFTGAIVKKFRSKLLDQTFGNKVRYFVMADDNWEVHLYATVVTGPDTNEKFQLADAPIFCPSSDDVIDQTAATLGIEEEEVERRLAGAERLGEACPGWLITEKGDSSPAASATPRVPRSRCTNRRRPGRAGCPGIRDTRTTRSARGAAASTRSRAMDPASRATTRSCATMPAASSTTTALPRDAARSLYAKRWTSCTAPDVSSRLG